MKSHKEKVMYGPAATENAEAEEKWKAARLQMAMEEARQVDHASVVICVVVVKHKMRSCDVHVHPKNNQSEVR